MIKGYKTYAPRFDLIFCKDSTNMNEILIKEKNSHVKGNNEYDKKYL